VKEKGISYKRRIKDDASLSNVLYPVRNHRK
jgi:hypothetical protein